MHTQTNRLLLSILLGCTVASVQAQAPQAASAPSASGGMDASMHEQMMKMQSLKPTGDPDRDFVMMMREHHRGAISMSQAYLRDGKDPTLRRMAQKIVADQKKEINQFDDWERKHGQAR